MSESVTRSPIELSAGQLKTSCCSSQTFLYLAIASTACWNPTAGYESYVHADQFLTCPVNRQMVNVLQATCLSMLHATSYKLHTNQFFQFSLCPINMQMVNVLQATCHMLQATSYMLIAGDAANQEAGGGGGDEQDEEAEPLRMMRRSSWRRRRI